jgi:hypothetical protein
MLISAYLAFFDMLEDWQHFFNNVLAKLIQTKLKIKSKTFLLARSRKAVNWKRRCPLSSDSGRPGKLAEYWGTSVYKTTYKNRLS